jgi:hypothetical protein
MSELQALASWVETTSLAQWVGGNVWVIAPLSAVHALAFTLVIGAGLFASLRSIGVVLPSLQASDVQRSTNRGIVLGLSVSVATGLLLLSPRATSALHNGLFQLKMLLLLAATTVHFGWHARVARRAATDDRPLKFAGTASLSLWLALALAACAFILFE